MRRERCVTSSSDKTTRSWKILEESQLVFRGPSHQLDCIDMLTEDSWVTGSQEGCAFALSNRFFREINRLISISGLHIWNVTRKKPAAQVLHAHGEGNWISAVACLPHSDVIASGSCDGVVRLWKAKDAKSLELIKELSVVRRYSSHWLSTLFTLAGGLGECAAFLHIGRVLDCRRRPGASLWKMDAYRCGQERHCARTTGRGERLTRRLTVISSFDQINGK